MEKREYNIGDIVRFRKKHPCGGENWKVIRVGMDFKVKCTTCGRLIMLPRRKFEKSVKEVVTESEKNR